MTESLGCLLRCSAVSPDDVTPAETVGVVEGRQQTNPVPDSSMRQRE